MDINQYQRLAGRTLIDAPENDYTSDELSRVREVLILASEAGQIANVVKKEVFHRHKPEPINMFGLCSRLYDTLQRLRGYKRQVPPIAEAPLIMRQWNGLGLMGEAAEVIEIATDPYWDDYQPAMRELLKEEVGDVLWYLAAICSKADIDMGDCAQGNIDKLNKRFPNGFSSEASINREGHINAET